METTKTTKTVISSFEQCSIDLVTAFVEGEKFTERTVDPKSFNITKVLRNETETTFVAKYSIHHIEFERRFTVTSSTNFSFQLEADYYAHFREFNFKLFNGLIVTDDVIDRLIDDHEDAPVGKMIQLKSECYSIHYDPHKLFPCVITFKKLKFGLLLSELSITVPNEVNDSLFERFCMIHQYFDQGPRAMSS